MSLKGKKKSGFIIFCLFKDLVAIPSIFGDEVNPEGMKARRDEKPGMFIGGGRQAV